MIIELPNYVSSDLIEKIRNSVRPFIPPNKQHTYNRDGRSVIISATPELKDLDAELMEVFSEVQNSVVQHRYKVKRRTGDSGYEYHLYDPKDVCHVHADIEIPFDGKTAKTSLLRYASVVLHLNTVEQGGELIFPSQNVSIKTEAGKIVVFPPYGMFQHYTTPSEQPREVVVTWFVYDGITVYER